MALELRPYQADLVSRVSAAFSAGVPSVLMQLGTGGGKTATSSNILERAVGKGYRSLFLAHLDSLISDTHERLVAAGVPAGFVQAGRPTDPEAPVQVASLQTLHARGERPPGDFIIIDEAHRTMSASVREILQAYPHAALLGLTATPQRGDGRPLGDVFERMICGPSNRWLTAHGFLVPCEILAPGSYQEEALAEDPVKAYARHARGKRAIVFASNKAHARTLAERYIEAGFSADVVVGETSRARRESLRDRLRSGKLQVLVGVSVFLEGWDCAEVEVVVLAKAFGVTGGFLQAIGRGLRPCPAIRKSRCLVIDLRGAVYLHGLPDEDRIWSLEGKAVRQAETTMALMRCAECLAVFRPARVCPRCGASCKAAAKIPRVLSRAEKLSRFDAMPQALRDHHYIERLVWVATARMRMPQSAAQRWAIAQFKKRFGREPAEGKAA